MPCRVRLDIYLVGYGGEKGKGEESREREKLRGRKGRNGEKGETEATSRRDRHGKGRGSGWKLKISLSWLADRAGLLSLKGQSRPLQILCTKQRQGNDPKSFWYCSFVVVLLFCFVLLFRDRVSLYNSSGCPGTCFVDQAGIVLTEIHLPLVPKFWD